MSKTSPARVGSKSENGEVNIASEQLARRPLKSRSARWPNQAAHRLIVAGLKPNQVSILSMAFAAVSGASLFLTSITDGAGRMALFLIAALSVQLRLLCNLLDGLMAVEGGLKSRTGDIFNDLPDRISDSLTLACAGYAANLLVWTPALGWAAALCAVLTAYVRILGGAVGTTQYFIGPMAKQHRMALITAACLLAAIESALGRLSVAIPLALLVIVLGSFLTTLRRTRRILQALESKGA